MDVTFDPATLVAIRNSYPNVRVKVTRTSGGTDTGCSGDRFAIKPADMVVQAYDTNWQAAGTNPATDRILNNSSATTGNVHAASTSGATTPRPFTLRATARNGAATPATTTNYAGTPTVKSGSPACVLPIGCATGTLSALNAGTWIAASGVLSAPAHYGEAGTFNLELEDLTFAAVHTADTTLSVRRIGQASAPLLVGRFVPDRFAFTAANTPQLQTFGASCTSARSFTYVGKPNWYATSLAPSGTVQAVNAGGAVTTNYPGTSFRLAASRITQTYNNNSASPALSCTLSDLTTACSPPNGPPPSVVAGGPALTLRTRTYTAASAGGVLTYARGA